MKKTNKGVVDEADVNISWLMRRRGGLKIQVLLQLISILDLVRKGMACSPPIIR